MSKSTGNLVTIDEFLSKYDSDVIRMVVLTGSYRAPLNYTEETLDAAEKSLERFKSGLRPALPNGKGLSPEAASALAGQAEPIKQAFIDTMDDDFNTAGALAPIYELVKIINTARDAGANDEQLAPLQGTLRELTGVFGLRLTEKTGSGDADKFIDLLVEVRREARAQKLWAFSDLIRDKLKELGVTIEDNKEGTSWRWS
jgi:cysteinyl-tRNA synthetase